MRTEFKPECSFGLTLFITRLFGSIAACANYSGFRQSSLGVRLRSFVIVGAIICVVEQLGAHSDTEELLDEANARLQEDPKKADHYLYRGDIYREAREWKKAAKDFEKAHRLNPDLVRFWYYRGRMRYESGNAGLAVADLNIYLAKQGDDPHGLLVRARALRKLRRYEPALVDYERALLLLANPGPEIFLENAEVYEMRNDLTRAVGVIEAGLGRIGPALALEIRLVEILRKQGNLKRALAVVELMLRRNPTDGELTRMRMELVADRDTKPVKQ